ncbi:ABC transporter ATP-binding protein/permease [Falcatimonas sp. MSJ-15]|uniref:ABC transporter ATP-binding protein/permease n=1 Tax=Falcatimonas sp. MSJ-15 TaxID=2841515 RepID=UPI001C123DC2|nr:ABC transporter ATP-binding protein/permease [Falcatimonas sp. MSJ-15]MBU5470262.1 ABC transporter ATP-binding protein/permease [Falcatimonas sp. MSJ-15]
MLQIKHIYKEYSIDKFKQTALDDVSLNLRDNEFVAILGPSGSGKTTLLNIIGGLDRYTSGDLIINGISTQNYTDRDWDSYRNHTIGFVFQSYNLIPHQTVLANVELALTISGISKSERKKRAKEALEKVGLGNQLNKRPSQMSGGQMQRVAIARALVNNPDILLADEPTGALDSDTSVQVMELLKEVSKDRLVVMVTHNPELAKLYATRIVEVKDGHLLADSDPYEPDKKDIVKPVHKNMGKSSMSFITATALSFQNLRTKKARTLLTSFAGSIGIIGIALILSISTGVNEYIKYMERDTLSEYPLQIQSTGLDLTSMMVGMTAAGEKKSDRQKDIGVTPMITGMFSQLNSNDLASLKNYLETDGDNINDYATSVEYQYSVTPQIYSINNDKVKKVNPDNTFAAMGLGSGATTQSVMSSMMSTDVFYELPGNEALYEDQYDIKAGRWPDNYNECVLVLTSQGNISDFLQYTLGLKDSSELEKMISQFMAEENVTVNDDTAQYSYDDILGTTFRVVNSSDMYEYDSTYNVWKDKSDNEEYVNELVKKGDALKIVGIVKPVEDATATMLRSGIWYTRDLTTHIMEYASNSDIVKKQLASKNINVFTGKEFGKESSESKLDLASMFKIDTETLSQAFKIDENAINIDMSSINPDMLNIDMSALSNSFDFENMFNMNNFSIDTSKLPDMNEILKQINFSISSEQMEKIATDILNGYFESIKDNPQADITRLGEGISAYLTSDEVASAMMKQIEDAVKNGITVDISQEQVLAEVAKISNMYTKYLKDNNITSGNEETLAAFLSQPEIRQLIVDDATKIVKDGVKINISREDMKKILSQNIMASYPDFAAKNGYPNPENMSDYFLEYLQSEDGKRRIANAMSQIVTANNLESQLTNIMNVYMESVASQIEEQIAAGMQTMSEQLTDVIRSSMTSAITQIMTQMAGTMSSSMGSLGESFAGALSIDPEVFAQAVQINMDPNELSELMMSLLGNNATSYDNNMKKLGYADILVPSEIDIYPKDFESKDEIIKILDAYNDKMEESGNEEQVIAYTDVVGTLMSSVTDIVNVISYVLIAFVAISLVVSSIMIGVITYISVLERRKEIGILRAIGASKRNISEVFNAETCIIGLCAGFIGIGLTILFILPINALIHHLAGIDTINAVLPVLPAFILIILSIILTFIGGLIPSKKAAKSDPVTALRNE